MPEWLWEMITSSTSSRVVFMFMDNTPTDQLYYPPIEN